MSATDHTTTTTTAHTHTQSAACCTLPAAVVPTGYSPKGTYTTVAGLRTYATAGAADAKRGVLLVYDIFGFWLQTLQGADLLAEGLGAGVAVWVPDFFEGEPADVAWYPPDNEEKGKKLGEFFKTKAAPPRVLPMVEKVVEEVKGMGVERLGAMGLCWGAKIVSLASGPNTPFTAAVAAHPAMVDPADAEKISIPLCMLASKDEDPEAVQKFEAALKGRKYVETFGDQVHGWMGARGRLEDERIRGEYARGWGRAVAWFAEFL